MNIRSKFVLSLGLGAALAASSVFAADTVESVQKAIAEKSQAVKSFSCRIKTEIDQDSGMFRMKAASTGTYDYMKKGDRVCFRSETDDHSETTVAGQSTKIKGKTTTVSDGETIHTLTEQADIKSCTKMKLQKTPNEPFKQYEGLYTFKLLPEATVDGKPCWAFELTPSGKDANLGKMHHFYQKDTGLLTKTISFDPAGKPATTMTYSDIKLNTNPSADVFKFTPPPGVQVMDLDAMKNPAKP